MISVDTFSQSSAEKIIDIQSEIEKSIPPDQLFLHLDRNLYNTGDTIRFQAFIRDYKTGVFETGSLSLHAMLLNSGHVTIDSARFRICYSTASGWLKVPENAPPGEYSLLAFTSGMMNYDPEYVSSIPFRVDKLQWKQLHSRHDSLLLSKDADLKFLPEGGTFITGIKQRLAFNAVTSDGISLKASGVIVNRKGERITEFQSCPYGPGVVEFTPAQGESYYAKPVEAEFRNMSWPLPASENSGVSLRVDNADSGMIKIIVKGRESSGKKYFLSVILNNVLIFSKDITLDTLFSTRIRTAEAPSGTAFVTLYDNELNPVAERLVFLNHQKRLNLIYSTSPATARPGQETELSINATNENGENVSSLISVSVIDSASGYDKNFPYHDIESVFLYDRHFYNNLPYNIKCLGLRNIDNRSIDLLMMTFGWRKYTLKEISNSNTVVRTDNFDHIRITNQGAAKKRRSAISLISPEGGRVITIGIGNNREAVLPFDSLETFVRQIMILPDEIASKYSNPVNIDFPENRTYTNKAKLIETDSTISKPEFVSFENEQPVYNPDSAIMIDPVEIKGKRKVAEKYVDKNVEEFRYGNTITLYSKDFGFAQTFEDLLYKLHLYKIFLRTKQVGISPRWLRGTTIIPALFVVDNSPIYDKTYIPIADMAASVISSVTVLNGYGGFARYGDAAYGGVIFVTTKAGNKINGIIEPNEETPSSGDLVKLTRLFRSEVEFYIPTKEEIEIIPEYKRRPTLLWKSDVYLDGSGPVKFKYPNNLVKGTVMIFVNGVSFSNLIGSNKFSYKTK
jgi:hypothetical protein